MGILYKHTCQTTTILPKRSTVSNKEQKLQLKQQYEVMLKYLGLNMKHLHDI